MKSIKRLKAKKLIIIGIILFGIIIIKESYIYLNQNRDELSKFTISIKIVDNKMVMKCQKGCSWEKLIYPINPEDEFIAIDEFGIAELNKVSRANHSLLANFLIKIRKTNSGLTLKGIKGTAWGELHFSSSFYNRFHKFNNFGFILNENN